ncbi:MAG: hypothetical protein M9958_03365 [Chitinophagales bacterium]|nr:hypothetical protein [Chitinophagales bacterium]
MNSLRNHWAYELTNIGRVIDFKIIEIISMKRLSASPTIIKEKEKEMLALIKAHYTPGEIRYAKNKFKQQVSL